MRYVEIKLTKHTLFLTEYELVRLLEKEPELWAEGIKRGKRFKRARRWQAKCRPETPA